jgi:hypothetical protein
VSYCSAVCANYDGFCLFVRKKLWMEGVVEEAVDMAATGVLPLRRVAVMARRRPNLAMQRALFILVVEWLTKWDLG